MATQEDVYSMYHIDDMTYYVDLTCEGEKTTFFVDTGFYNVTITPEQLKKWGKFKPGEDFASVDFEFHGTVYEHTCIVEDYDCNYLGMDILHYFNCTLNLQDDTLTFRDFNDDYFDKCDEFMFETVTVNGKDVDVFIDTGSTGYIMGNMEVAQKLNLVLHDVTHLNLKLEHVSDTVQVKYSSYLNHMKIKDREWGLVTYVVDDADLTLSVGVAAIRGAIIHLYHDGSHEMLLSGKLDLEEEERTLVHENQVIIRHEIWVETEEDEPDTNIQN